MTGSTNIPDPARTRIWCGIAVALLALVTLLAPAKPQAQERPHVTLVQNGQPVAAIYVEGPLLSPEEVTSSLGRRGARVPEGIGNAYLKSNLARSAAVFELIEHIERMTGATLAISVTDDITQIDGPAIVLGALANAVGAEPELHSPSKEGFRILTRPDQILIGAESDLGMRHGVYELLRRIGFDWVMPGEIGQVIPDGDSLAVVSMDISEAPDFQFRRMWYRGYPGRDRDAQARFGLWKWRHKGGSPRHRIEDAQGHTWQAILRKYKSEFEADPTMLALVRASDGTLIRRGPQLEPTHPRVIEIFANQIRTMYARNIASGLWTRETTAAFPIGPADGLDFSRSPETIASGSGRSDAIVGVLDQTDPLILFSNRILEAVEEEYPNAQVGYYTYAAHADFPEAHKPHPNVVQIFAPINYSRFHGITSPVSKSQSHYRDVVEKWSALSEEQMNDLAFYGYNWNLADNLLPYSKIAIWGNDLPFYYLNNISGLILESTKQWSVLAPSDYVFMRMAWDVSQDWRDVLHEYTDSAYGKGAAPMYRYWMRLTERQQEAGMEAGSYHAFPLIYDLGWVSAAEKEIAEALTLADTAADQARIRYAAIGLEFLRLYLEYHAATLEFKFAESERIYEEMFSHWDAAYAENEDLVANEAPHYLDGLLGEFVERARKYTSAPFEIVARLPDELKTAFDPYAQGERMGLHQPEIQDAHFITTRTFSSTWDAQGLAGLRDGAVWYRWHFTLPESARNRPLALFLGGVEDTANVWLNGKKVGGAGPAFSSPMAFDLSDSVDVESENLLAIQVVRTSKFNEIGLGGIIRPSFLFTRTDAE